MVITSIFDDLDYFNNEKQSLGNRYEVLFRDTMSNVIKVSCMGKHETRIVVRGLGEVYDRHLDYEVEEEISEPKVTRRLLLWKI